MTKKFAYFVLAILIILGSPSAHAALVMNLGSTSVDIGVPVVITISSDAGGMNAYDWGVYLEPTEVGGPLYPGTDAELQNAAILLPAAGPSGSTTRYLGYEYGDDYQAKKQGQTKPFAGDWSTVDFVGHVAGTYTVYLYDYTANGGDYTIPGTAADTQTITVTAIPEPATIVLLGLGSLALIRRRKA